MVSFDGYPFYEDCEVEFLALFLGASQVRLTPIYLLWPSCNIIKVTSCLRKVTFGKLVFGQVKQEVPQQASCSILIIQARSGSLPRSGSCLSIVSL